MYEGREYDYVFDVDIQDGVPPLKLPYNASGEQIVLGLALLALAYCIVENPYTAAQRFLQSNDLPMSYLDQVVQFIEKNTAGVNISSANNQFVDPYTGEFSMGGLIHMRIYLIMFSGASRYQATQATSSSNASEFMDPFTGKDIKLGIDPPIFVSDHV